MRVCVCVCVCVCAPMCAVKVFGLIEVCCMCVYLREKEKASVT